MLSNEVLDLRQLEDATLLGLTNLNLPAALKAAAKRELDSRSARGPRFEQMPEEVPFKHGEAWYIWKRYPAIGKTGSFAFSLDARGALYYDYTVEREYVGEAVYAKLRKSYMHPNDTLTKNGALEMLVKLVFAASDAVHGNNQSEQDEDYD